MNSQLGETCLCIGVMATAQMQTCLCCLSCCFQAWPQGMEVGGGGAGFIPLCSRHGTGTAMVVNGDSRSEAELVVLAVVL